MPGPTDRGYPRSYTIIAPYMAEVWPAGLRASGMGLGYGVGNFGKIISPLPDQCLEDGITLTQVLSPAASNSAKRSAYF